MPFNDLDALDAALGHGDVAALLMEPALTNIGIVLPHAGYHDAVREITRRHGVLLIIDETHTISAGPGGCTQAWGLDPDIVVIGKPIGGGFPVATYGVTDEIAAALDPALHGHDADVGGVGGTLAGSAMATAAIRATLSTTLLDHDYARMIPLATRWTDGVARPSSGTVCHGRYSSSGVEPNTGSVRRLPTALMRRPPSMISSMRSCTCGH